MSEAVPSKVPVFDEDNIVFSFGAISDTHINSTTNAYAQKLVNALNQMKAKASEKDPDGLDAVVVAGDLTDQPSATATQIL
jgi:3',5'-cyclic AMP phosphodiesterase CpdA